MILEDKHGNLFNVEACIEYESDPEELKILCRALFEEVKNLKAVNKAMEAVNEGKNNSANTLEGAKKILDIWITSRKGV